MHNRAAVVRASVLLSLMAAVASGAQADQLKEDRQGIVRGRVLDSQRQPLPHAELSVVEVARIGQTGMFEFRVAFTDANGAFAADGIAAGEYVVGVNIIRPAEDALPYTATYFPGVHDPATALIVRVVPGADIALGDLTLPPPLKKAVIAGRAFLPDGRPASGAYVRLLDATIRVQYAAGEGVVREDGAFSVDGFAGERYIVHVIGMGGKNPLWGESEPVAAGDGATIEIHLKPKRAE